MSKDSVTTSIKTALKPLDYRQAAEAVLKHLKRDRDRQIIARRFGFGMAKRQTLEKIGQDFGITRERVRQIEKATLARTRQAKAPEAAQAELIFKSYLETVGGISTAADLAQQLGVKDSQAYILFLASLAPDIAVIDEDDQLRLSLGLLPDFDRRTVKQLAGKLAATVEKLSTPQALSVINQASGLNLPPDTLASLAAASKELASYDELWGLARWPEVNPKSIRDKTYLVMHKHGQPLHFSAIADHIRNSNFSRRDVTVQAVHNELIKDPRFILIGRGIYALAEWGYTPGTVADIIIEILREESPLHKDEIIKRVMKKRQVKHTTIALNLQEKDQFERVAKATYKLKEK